MHDNGKKTFQALAPGRAAPLLLCRVRADRDDAAPAQEGPHQPRALHGLAGHHDQGPAAHTAHQGKPAERPHFLLLVSISVYMILL